MLSPVPEGRSCEAGMPGIAISGNRSTIGRDASAQPQLPLCPKV
jgi:hypothetical protein